MNPGLSAANPSRAPDWRWQRAIHIADSNHRYSATRDDEHVRRALEFVRHCQRLRTEAGMRSLVLDYADVHSAHQFYRDQDARTLELKARILARQDSEVIAELAAVPVPSVETFKSLFFDVYDRLDASSYIVRQVIGLPLDAQPTAEKLFLLGAYTRGPAVIDAWLDYLAHSLESRDLTTEVGRQREAIDLYVASKMLSCRDSSAGDLLKCFAAVSQLPSSVARIRTPGDIFEGHAQQIWHDFDWERHCEPDHHQQDWQAPKAG